MNDKTITAWVLAGGLLAAAMGAMTNDDGATSPLEPGNDAGGSFVVPEEPGTAALPQPPSGATLGPGRLRYLGVPAAEVLGQVAPLRNEGGAPVPGVAQAPLVGEELAWGDAELQATETQLQGYADKDPGWLASEVETTQGFAQDHAERIGAAPGLGPGPEPPIEPPEVPDVTPPEPPGGGDAVERQKGLVNETLDGAGGELEDATGALGDASACASPPALADKMRCMGETATEVREDLQQQVGAVWSEATAAKETTSRQLRENGSALLEQARGSLDEAHDRVQQLPSELRDAAEGPLGEVQDAKERCLPMEKRGLDGSHQRDLVDRARCADPRVGVVDDAVHERLGEAMRKVAQGFNEVLDEAEARLDEAGDGAETVRDIVGEHTDDWVAFVGDLYDPGPREG